MEDEPIPVADDLRGFDFELSVYLENETYEADNGPIKIEIILRSGDKRDIKLETYEIDFPEVIIIDPNGYERTIFHGNISVAPNYVIIGKNEEIRTEIDLKRSDYWNGTPFLGSAHPMD